MTFVAPGWEIEANYPDPRKQSDLSVWAWEFLRRNKSYQAAWKEYVDRLYKIADRLPQLRPVLDYVTAGPDSQSPVEGLPYRMAQLGLSAGKPSRIFSSYARRFAG